MRILRKEETAAKIGLSDRSLRRLEDQGLFPKRVALSPRAVGHLESEIDAWIAERAAAREPSAA